MAEIDWALVTGASSGIGECFARALAARGRNLLLVARRKDKLVALAEALRSERRIEAEPMETDLSLPGAGTALAGRLEARRLGVTLLVNNAGFGARGRIWELLLDRQAEMLRLNIQAVFELTYALLPAMVKAGRGGIINVSSTASFQPVPYTSCYAASKAFVTSFSMGLAEELQPCGVKVVTLCPGGTDTNFFQASNYGLRPLPRRVLQPPEEVVEAALSALDRGGGLVVPGLMNKLGVISQRFVPRSVVVWAAGRIFRI